MPGWIAGKLADTFQHISLLLDLLLLRDLLE
jgi:hypothetical protein